MARKLRVEFAGACYHVLNRGNYRADLFAIPGAKRSFQHCLFEACARFLWQLHAYVIMRNHFHLALETPEPNLSLGMQWLQGTWAVRFNRFLGESGQPFQGRYKAIHVESGEPLARVTDYIHLNPVRAKLVPFERLGTYRWSSFPLLHNRNRPTFVASDNLLRNTGGWADSAAGWRGYREHLAAVAGEESIMGAKAFGRFSRGWAIGSRAFRARLNADLVAQSSVHERFELLGADREAHVAARAELWEERLQAVASVFRIELSSLPPRRSCVEKLRLASALKQITSVSNGWLAHRLQMGAPSSVGSLLSHFRATGGTRTRAFKAALARFAN